MDQVLLMHNLVRQLGANLMEIVIEIIKLMESLIKLMESLVILLSKSLFEMNKPPMESLIGPLILIEN